MLRVLSGPQTGAQIALREGLQLVGSDEHACDVVLFGGGIAGAHCRLESLGPRAVRVLVEHDAPVQLNGQLLPTGSHGVEVPAHLRLADVDLLLHAAADPAAEGLPDDDAAPRPSAPRGRVGRWIAGIACVLGVGVFMSGAMGWFEKAEPREIAGVRHALSQIGYRDLSVAYDVEGLLTVTGYVRSAQEAERLRKAMKDYPGKAVAVRVAVVGAATQLDRTMPRRPDETHRLGAGSVLIEPQMAATASQPAAGNALDLQVKALRAGDDGYVETTGGARYFIGSQMPGGYTLKTVADDMITLTRDETDIRVPVQH
jgi:hypothetical protein